jgi:hypothetical protein
MYIWVWCMASGVWQITGAIETDGISKKPGAIFLRPA